jgi:thiamine biosynthesis lipoprotein ApbE
MASLNMCARSIHLSWALWLLIPLMSASACAGEIYVFHHDNVVGTSLEIQVRADSETSARAAEGRVLERIDQLSKILSSYDATSELSRWTAKPDVPTSVSPELADVLIECDRWRVATQGAFHPSAEVVCRLWRQCSREKRLPSSAEIAAARQAASAIPWEVDATTRMATLKVRTPLTLDALSKGYVIDRALEAALRVSPGVTGVLVNIGGDLRVAGDLVSTVGIADPRNDSETTPPIATVRLNARAIATSGNYQRGVTIGSHTYSHIVDPRTGQPVEHVISASVVSSKAVDADALATICSVLPVKESIALIESLPDTECLLICRNGDVVRSGGWDAQDGARLQLVGFRREATTAMSQDKQAHDKQEAQKPATAGQEGTQGEKKTAPTSSADAKPDKEASSGEWPAGHELEVGFEVANQSNSQRYCRPYVAIWVEDKDGFPVRTLVLWVWTSGPGPRWIPDLRRWYRSDQFRQVVDDTNLVDTVSRATRPPGKYRAVWDGKDDHGKPVTTGKYTIYIEAAREHGTYQVLSKALTIDNKLFTEELPGNVEIKSATLEYRTTAKSGDK